MPLGAKVVRSWAQQFSKSMVWAWQTLVLGLKRKLLLMILRTSWSNSSSRVQLPFFSFFYIVFRSIGYFTIQRQFGTSCLMGSTGSRNGHELLCCRSRQSILARSACLEGNNSLSFSSSSFLFGQMGASKTASVEVWNGNFYSLTLISFLSSMATCFISFPTLPSFLPDASLTVFSTEMGCENLPLSCLGEGGSTKSVRKELSNFLGQSRLGMSVGASWSEQSGGSRVCMKAAWRGVSAGRWRDMANIIDRQLYKRLIIISSTMPRVATANKQKNRPFKRSGKASRKGNTTQKIKSTAAPKSKGIKKLSKVERMQVAKLKKSRQAEKLAAANEYLDAQTKGSVTERIKSQNEIRIVLLVPCNEQADVSSLMNSIYTYSVAQSHFVVNNGLKACMSYPAFQVLPGPNRSPIKNRLYIIGTDRDPAKLIDLAKCADIVCPVVSALAANPQRITEDPFGNAGTFDEAGYATVNLLRSIGVSRVVGLIQHLDAVENKHRDKVEKFYRRFLQSQFGDEKCLSAGSEESGALLRVLDSVGVTPAAWKAHRGYMLPDQIESSPEGNLVLSGFLKGNCISPNQIAHLTGLGEFHIEKIEIQSIGKSRNSTMAEQLIQYSTSPDDLEEFAKPETHQDEEDILTALNGLQIEQPVEQPRDEGMEDEDESEDDEADWEDQQELEDNRAEQKARRMEMHMRQDEQLEFEDEVEYAAEEILREKYREYQGLKSFKSSGWNQLQNLPHQYDRIYFFKRYSQTQQAALKDNLARGFAYPGFYVRITLAGIKVQAAAAYAAKLPLVLSFLLKHERKMTVLHGKVKRNPFYEGSAAVESGKMVMVSIGFKRLVVSPLYSRCINGTQKTKSTKEVGEDYDNHYFCSFYGHNTFPPSPFLVFRVNPLFPSQIEGAPVMRGELTKCDPMHVILERIIITGYPFKINRRRSTVRYMFFNPHDVKYFRPVEVRTKMGLRGKIEESLGTHGMMKVLFNEQIKHNDTVCMHLYRRVYPPATF